MEEKKVETVDGKCPLCRQELPKKAGKGEIWRVIEVYRISLGFDGGPNWNRTMVPIHSKAARDMISFIGNWKDAADCIQDTIEKIREWNPEANPSMQKILAHHAPIWKQKRLEEKAKRGE